MLKELKDLGVLKINPITGKKLSQSRRFKEYECPFCFKSFPSIENNVKRGGVSSCRSCQVSRKNFKHGDHIRGKTTKLYQRWLSLRNRCNNPKNPSYKNYGGRGITVCTEWGDYSKFKLWAQKTGYAPELEIDRKNNDQGYSPSNCRWVTSTIQSCNGQLIRRSNTSGYRGVIWHKKSNKWAAQIGYKNKKYYLGLFISKIEAAQAYNNKIDIAGWPHTKNRI